jgi:hypothetical protein
MPGWSRASATCRRAHRGKAVLARARSIEVYLKPGIEEDDQVHEIWKACRGRARPQDVFRRAIRLGLRAMAEAGELPRAALEAIDPDLLGPPGPARALLARGLKARIRPTPEPAPRPQQDEAPIQTAPETPVSPVSQTQVLTPAATPSAPAPLSRKPALSPLPEPAAEPRKPKLGRIM